MFLAFCTCGNPAKIKKDQSEIALMATDSVLTDPVIVAANRTGEYLPLLKGKKVGVVANQTSVIFKNTGYEVGGTKGKVQNTRREKDRE